LLHCRIQISLLFWFLCPLPLPRPLLATCSFDPLLSASCVASHRLDQTPTRPHSHPPPLRTLRRLRRRAVRLFVRPTLSFAPTLVPCRASATRFTDQPYCCQFRPDSPRIQVKCLNRTLQVALFALVPMSSASFTQATKQPT
jgi:hypothetical protein